MNTILFRILKQFQSFLAKNLKSGDILALRDFHCIPKFVKNHVFRSQPSLPSPLASQSEQAQTILQVELIATHGKIYS